MFTRRPQLAQQGISKRVLAISSIEVVCQKNLFVFLQIFNYIFLGHFLFEIFEFSLLNNQLFSNLC